jgi:hypothetical protein
MFTNRCRFLGEEFKGVHWTLPVVGVLGMCNKKQNISSLCYVTRWVHDVKECLELGDVEKLDKLVNYFSLKTIAAFVASTKDNISGVLDNGITVPRTCYLNITSPYWAAGLNIKEIIPSFIVGGLVLVTQEAVNIRVTAIIEVFLKKHYSYVFETPTKFLDAMKIKFIKTEILRVTI